MGRYLDIIKKDKNFQKPNMIRKTENINSSNLSYYLLIIALIFILFLSIFSLDKTSSAKTANNDNVNKPENIYANTNSENMSDYPNLPESDQDSTQSSSSLSSNENNLEKSKISIQVLNGSNKPNAAKNTQDILENNGFIVLNIGNSDNYYNNSTIFYQPGNKETSALVASTLSEYKFTLEEDEEISGVYDIVVIIGKN